ncbi:hypothetical protein MPSEU_000998000 [Mayamaea pseudoterrestris]|nr:hypothetical protein MPSEU_000998000 [Mayamaea pseudoterrestris]
MALSSYRLYQQPQDQLGLEIDRFWSVLFTVDANQSQSTMMDNDMNGNAAYLQTAVYIRGLHASFSEAHLVKLLMPFGQLEQIQLIAHEGYAICCFASPRSAQACMQTLNNRMLLGRALSICPAPISNRYKRSFGDESTGCMSSMMEMETSPIRAIRRKLNGESYLAY